jgi:shikimate dehydrogenase
LSAEALAALPGHAIVYDLIYNPLESPLLAAARARGLATHNGLDMLVRQAAHAFFRWTGQQPPQDLMRRAALAQLERTSSCSAS